MSKVKMLVLSLTGKCNFSCNYCYAIKHNSNKMTKEIALAAIKLIATDNEGFIIQFSGGEPLLNFPVIKEVTEYVRRNNLPVILQLQTNGSLLTDKIAQYLYKNHIAIGISLDGRPSINDQLRIKKNGYGATGDILKGVEVLRRNNIACGMTCVVTDVNVNYLSGVVEFAYFLGCIRKIGFDILRMQGKGSNLKIPTAQEMELAMRQVYAKRDELAKLTGLYIKITQEERLNRQCNTSNFNHCYAMNGDAAFVDASGNIYACASLVGDENFYLGNVYCGIREDLLHKVKQTIKESMSFCTECKDFASCGGGCFARWYGLEDKNAYEAECSMQRVSIEYLSK